MSPPSYLTTQVQPSSSPRPEQNTNDEKQQTLHRMSTMPESTYQEAVKNETYRENRNNAKNAIPDMAQLNAKSPTRRDQKENPTK
jgi:hypothetical protein